MEFYMDWKFWIFGIQILTLGFGFFSHQKIVYNDLKHLAQDTNEIKNKQEEQSKKITHIETEVAYIKGMKENEDRVIKLLENTCKK